MNDKPEVVTKVNESLNRKIAEDAKKTFYTARDNETRGLAKELAADGNLEEAEDVLHAYGIWLESRPEAWDYLSHEPINKTVGPLKPSVA